MEKVTNLYSALIAAQAEFLPALKDTKNSFFKSSYAPLDSIWNACKEPLAKNRLMVSQITDILENGTTILITRVYDETGEFIQSKLPIINSKPNDPQAFGSALTYARRYSLAAILGIVTDDDDGEGAMDRDSPKKNTQAKKDQPSAVDMAIAELNICTDRECSGRVYHKYPQFHSDSKFMEAVANIAKKYPKQPVHSNGSQISEMPIDTEDEHAKADQELI